MQLTVTAVRSIAEGGSPRVVPRGAHAIASIAGTGTDVVTAARTSTRNTTGTSATAATPTYRYAETRRPSSRTLRVSSSAGTGGLNTKPCPSVQPCSTR
jgi:hypothetical protein